MNNPGEPIIGTGTFPGSAFSEEPAVRKADYDALRAQAAALQSQSSCPLSKDIAGLVNRLECCACLLSADEKPALAGLLREAASALQSIHDIDIPALLAGMKEK